MFRSVVGLVAIVGVSATIPARGADAPLHLNHQGVIAVQGARFNGQGDFWFALIDPATGGNLWTHDGSRVGEQNQQPDTAVSLTVINGIYNVRLGDNGMANIDSSIFNMHDVALRIWFDDGVNGSHQLAPDQPASGVPFAFRSATIDDNAVTTTKIVNDAVTSAKIASSAASLNKVSGGAMSSVGGNVGIGVSPAEQRLHVAGNFKTNRFTLDQDGFWGRMRIGTGQPDGQTRLYLRKTDGVTPADLYTGAVSASSIGTNSITADSATLGQEAWQAAALICQVNFGFGTNPAGVFKDSNGIVHLRGTIKDCGGFNVPLFDLPVGYRPANTELFLIPAGPSTDSLIPWPIRIRNNGRVELVNTQSFHDIKVLDGITFRAAN